LRQDADPADAGIETIRHREIDNAELATEKHCGLRATIGQIMQPAAATAREHQRDRTPGQSFLGTIR
jgi:hypothetical protein